MNISFAFAASFAIAGAFAGTPGCASQRVQTPAPPEAPAAGDKAAPPPGTPLPVDTADAGVGGGSEQPDTRALYERLGGKDAIVAVVDDFVGRTTTDPRIMDRFFNTDAAELKVQLADFVCAATGGPCTYGGREMGEVHAGMELVDEEFGALVEDLAASLEHFHDGAREKGELLGALGPLQPAIVVDRTTLQPIAETHLAEVTAAAGQLGETDGEARRLLEMAVVAGRRGQRNYAEQLFSRAELVAGADRLAVIAGVFREGAPPRIATAPTQAVDTAPQPAAVGSSEDEPADKKPAKASLRGRLQIDGGPVHGLGVIMLTPARGGKKRVAKHRVVEQRDKAFAPHILAVPVGSTVAFPNFDKVFHNVFSLSKGASFDLGLYRNGEQREVRFDRPGVVRLGCNIHAGMSAYVVVVDAPHYVVGGDDGSFAFRRLAPGAYTVRAWSERTAEPAVSRIVVKPGANEQVIDLAGDAAAGPGPDKFSRPRGSEPHGGRP
jgi:hemoglobin